MTEIVQADRGMIREVLHNLREDDLLEMIAAGANLNTLPEMLMRHRVFAFCACEWDHGPISVWGMTQHRPGVGGGFAFGTARWGMVLLPMLRQIRQFVLPFLLQSGFHRVEAAALARRTDVARFMALIGAEPEGVLQQYGTGGEDFISYRWLADEYASRTVSREKAHGSYAAH
jgi:hypothetical protein